MKYPIGTEFHSYETFNGGADLTSPMWGTIIKIEYDHYTIEWEYSSKNIDKNTYDYTEYELDVILSRLYFLTVHHHNFFVNSLFEI